MAGCSENGETIANQLHIPTEKKDEGKNRLPYQGAIFLCVCILNQVTY